VVVAQEMLQRRIAAWLRPYLLLLLFLSLQLPAIEYSPQAEEASKAA
jgi:hypothetical protein